MTPSLFFRLCLLLLCWQWPFSSQANCPPDNTSQQQLLDLRTKKFVIDDGTSRESFALDLITCLQSPNPVLRDQIAYEAYATWMRGNQLSPQTVSTLLSQLIAWLPPDQSDPAGFAKPFAALVLSEIARMDRIETFMTDAQRQQLVDAITDYLSAVTDYRGFDADSGWRHGVAHSADVILQLSLNPKITTQQVQQMAKAIASQIAPGTHAYIYGEQQRLARAVFYMLTTSYENSEQDADSNNTQPKQALQQWWKNWFASLNDTINSDQLFTNQIELTKRHNLLNFYTALYLYISENGGSALKDGVQSLLVEGVVKLS